MVKEVKEITQNEYTQLILSSKMNPSAIDNAVATIAVKSGWHPAGYGCMRPRIYTENGKCYAEWFRSETCD